RTFGDQIRLETGPNRGGNVTRNRLLELASGDWLQFLDADDYLLPGKIANQLQAAAGQTDQVDVVYSPPLVEVWNSSGEREESSAENYVAEDPLSLQWIRWHVAQTGTVLWRAEALRSIGGWNEEYPCCQDNEVTLRAILSELRFLLVNRAEAVYRIWSEQTVCRKNPQRVIEVKTSLIDQMMAWLQDQPGDHLRSQQAAGQACFEMARTLAQHSIPTAAAYRSERVQKGLFCPTGPAAPLTYRLVQKWMGFSNAERVARWRRHG
ncbi:MAG: glycosyltransferase, partial [Planctomycetaceae bacterium]|nr:glycosyltransferase [Planctomycetaceae bacterium]